jgi:hypothetical protein
VSVPRDQVLRELRRSGLMELADEAERTLADPVKRVELERFAAAHNLSTEQLMDRLSGNS